MCEPNSRIAKIFTGNVCIQMFAKNVWQNYTKMQRATNKNRDAARHVSTKDE